MVLVFPEKNICTEIFLLEDYSGVGCSPRQMFTLRPSLWPEVSAFKKLVKGVSYMYWL